MSEELPVSLDELVKMVEARTPHEDPLGRIGAAVAVAADMDALSDNVVGHFVDVARAAGLPWSQIGAALGVTKQAAQQRFVPRDVTSVVLTRSTPRVRTLLEAAARHARERKHNYIGTEHLALGMCDDAESLAVKVLGALGGTVAAVHSGIEARIGPPSPGASGTPMYTPRAAKVLELAVREALRLGHNYIGTEHILIALVSHEGLGGDVLRELGLTEERARGEVVHALSGLAPKRSGDAAG
jgi:hypothetical protein